jgi:hypothetical protein
VASRPPAVLVLGVNDRCCVRRYRPPPPEPPVPVLEPVEPDEVPLPPGLVPVEVPVPPELVPPVDEPEPLPAVSLELPVPPMLPEPPEVEDPLVSVDEPDRLLLVVDEPADPVVPALITSMRLTWSESPVPEKLARTWSPSLMSVIVPCCPSFITCVSSLTLSFLSEFASVSSFESLSNFSTVPVSCCALEVLMPLDAVAPEEPVPDVVSLDDPVPLLPIEPEPLPVDPVPLLAVPDEPVPDEPLPL